MGYLEDKIVGAAIDKTEENLENGGKTPKKHDNPVVRFIVTLIWFIILLIINFVTFGLGFIGTMRDTFEFLDSGIFHDSRTLEIVGIITSGVFALITFIIPYLRRKGSFTKWMGIISIGDVIWYAYLIISNG